MEGSELKRISTCAGALSVFRCWLERPMRAGEVFLTIEGLRRHPFVATYADMPSDALLRWVQVGGSNGGGHKLARSLYETGPRDRFGDRSAFRKPNSAVPSAPPCLVWSSCRCTRIEMSVQGCVYYVRLKLLNYRVDRSDSHTRRSDQRTKGHAQVFQYICSQGPWRHRSLLGSAAYRPRVPDFGSLPTCFRPTTSRTSKYRKASC